MTSCGHETNPLDDEFHDQDGIDTGDFIVESEDDDNVHVGEQELPAAEEEYEEEEKEPPVGQQEILTLRERLKAEVRRKMKANNAEAGEASCSPPVQEPVRFRHSSIFGPSTPSFARRVIEEGCSSIMKEIQNAPSGKDATALASKMQPNASTHQQKPKFVSEEKRKADTLRQNRDYSSLLSDDADIPLPKMEQPDNAPAAMAPKSDVAVRGPTQSAGKSKVSMNQPAKVSKDHGSNQSRVQTKVGSLGKEPLPNGKKMIPAARNGSSLPNIKKPTAMQPSTYGQTLQRSMQSKKPQGLPTGQRQQQPPAQIQRPQQPSQSQRQQNHGEQPSPGRRMNSSLQIQRSAQKGLAHSPHDRPKLAQKQLGPSSKPKLSRANAGYDDHAKKQHVVKRKCNDEEAKIRSMVRGIFNYNPEKYTGRDEDDSDMEADYASIQMEERRSAKLARKEDQEQLRLIEEEEKRERLMKRKE